MSSSWVLCRAIPIKEEKTLQNRPIANPIRYYFWPCASNMARIRVKSGSLGLVPHVKFFRIYIFFLHLFYSVPFLRQIWSYELSRLAHNIQNHRISLVKCRQNLSRIARCWDIPSRSIFRKVLLERIPQHLAIPDKFWRQFTRLIR